MKRAVLIRHRDNGSQTIGSLIVFDDAHRIFSCRTLEPAWLDNQKNISCIPAGSMLDIGEKNVVAILEALSKQNLKVKGEEVRGNIGRTVFLHISDGKTVVKTAMNQIVEL